MPKQGEKHGNGGRTASNFGVPTASRVFGRSNEPSGRLQDYDLTEFLDDWRAIEESPNHFHDPVPDLDDMEADAGDTLDGFNGKTDKGRGVHEPYDYLQTVVELLRSLEDARVKTRGLEW